MPSPAAPVLPVSCPLRRPNWLLRATDPKGCLIEALLDANAGDRTKLDALQATYQEIKNQILKT
jgi:hypothetical protein